MKKSINLTLFALVLSLTLVSAIPIYSGESIELELEKPFNYYSIVGNSTEVVLDITQEGNKVTITPSKYSLNDTYEVIFFDREKETITVYQSSGGGGGGGSRRTVYKDRNVTELVVVDHYEDKEVEVSVEVPGETVEVEKIVKKTRWWTWVIILLLISVIFYIVVRRSKNNE